MIVEAAFECNSLLVLLGLRYDVPGAIAMVEITSPTNTERRYIVIEFTECASLGR